MQPTCPTCKSTTVKKNGRIHNGKQNHKCLSCRRQFVINPQQKIIDDKTREQVRQALLERVSLEGICRIFKVSMPWLLGFLNEVIAKLPDHLNATLTSDGQEFEVAVLELDEQWSYVGNKSNPQWLWLIFHSQTRQVLAMHIGKRTRQSAEILLKKLPEDLKKKPFITQINLESILRLFRGTSIGPLEKGQARQAILRDLITLSDKGALGS